MRKISITVLLAIVALAVSGVASAGGSLPAPLTLYPARDGAPAAWSGSVNGSGVGIAIIDSGGTSLSDFSGRYTQVTLTGQNSAALADTYGHGTLVSGIAGGYGMSGKYTGIAYKANLYEINVTRDGMLNSGDVITGLKWVFDNAHRYNIRVVNLSFTESSPSSYLTNALDLAVERLWAAGVMVVVAAGDRGTYETGYAPANDPLALVVGAYDMNDTATTADDFVSAFSSNGPTLDGFGKPEILAPGRHIVSTLPASTTMGQLAPAANKPATGYASVTGTAYAAPQVAGAAAMIFQKHPTWSPDQVKWLLTTKGGAPVAGSALPTLTLTGVYNFTATPGLANQGVQALVCAPGSTCTTGSGTVASSWNSSSWNSRSWSSSSWNSSSWNSSSWNGKGWESSGWTSSSWNSSSWNSSSWNTAFAIYSPW
jgi:serine protease AprX